MRLLILALASTALFAATTAPGKEEIVLFIEGMLEGIMQEEGKNYTNIV
jgi:hypothetical protein